MNSHRLGWVAYTPGIYCLTALEAGSPKSRCQRGWFLLVPSEACLLGSAHKRIVFSRPLPSGCVCVLISSRKDTDQMGSGPTLMASSNVITSLKTLSPHSHILRSWRLGLRHTDLGVTVLPIVDPSLDSGDRARGSLLEMKRSKKY